MHHPCCITYTSHLYRDSFAGVDGTAPNHDSIEHVWPILGRCSFLCIRIISELMNLDCFVKGRQNERTFLQNKSGGGGGAHGGEEGSSMIILWVEEPSSQ